MNAAETDRLKHLAARYGAAEALGVRFNEREEVSCLPDGRRLAVCTECARFIRDREPNTRIVGYLHADNPSVASELAFGHDFAIVDNRYIVDPWIVLITGEARRAVFDLLDPEDSGEIHRLYGDREKWGSLDPPAGEPVSARTGQ